MNILPTIKQKVYREQQNRHLVIVHLYFAIKEEFKNR